MSSLKEPQPRSSTRRLEVGLSHIGPLTLTIHGQSRVLRPGTSFTVGRREDCDLQLKSDAVSTFHARIESSDEGWRVQDLYSTNGTYLDGVRIQNAVLPSCGTLRLADTDLPFSQAKVERSEVQSFHGIIGTSAAMQSVFEQIEVIAPLDEPVLVLGETGSGKELIASAIHAASRRASRELLARNCGSMPEGLADAELFGASKGAFSGAENKPGVFEGARGGTVFLDELGELSLSVQPKLLRALQEKKVRRLGTVQEKPVDFRLVTATHRNLDHMVQRSEFRQDLFHRISVFTIRVPPLRERKDDIPDLARYLVGSRCDLTDAAIEKLMAYTWPGNVREFRNTLIRASSFARGASVSADNVDLPVGRTVRARRTDSVTNVKQGVPKSDEEATVVSSPPHPPKPTKRRHRKWRPLQDERTEKITRDVWKQSGGSVTKAAEQLGIAKSTMHRRKAIYQLPDDLDVFEETVVDRSTSTPSSSSIEADDPVNDR